VDSTATSSTYPSFVFLSYGPETDVASTHLALSAHCNYSTQSSYRQTEPISPRRVLDAAAGPGLWNIFSLKYQAIIFLQRKRQKENTTKKKGKLDV